MIGINWSSLENAWTTKYDITARAKVEFKIASKLKFRSFSYNYFRKSYRATNQASK